MLLQACLVPICVSISPLTDRKRKRRYIHASSRRSQQQVHFFVRLGRGLACAGVLPQQFTAKTETSSQICFLSSSGVEILAGRHLSSPLPTHDNMAAKLTYMMSPNWSFVPYTGSVRLGSLLADPTKPDRPPTTLDLNELVQSGRSSEIEKISDRGVEVIRSGRSSVFGAVWAQFINTASAGLSAERASEKWLPNTMNEVRTGP